LIAFCLLRLPSTAIDLMDVSSSESSEPFERIDPLSQDDMEWYGDEEVDADVWDDFELDDELEPEEETSDGTPSDEGT